MQRPLFFAVCQVVMEMKTGMLYNKDWLPRTAAKGLKK